METTAVTIIGGNIECIKPYPDCFVEMLFRLIERVFVLQKQLQCNLHKELVPMDNQSLQAIDNATAFFTVKELPFEHAAILVVILETNRIGNRQRSL